MIQFLQEAYVDRVDEELEKLRAMKPGRVMIANDDAKSICTRAGWEAYQKQTAADVVPPDVPNARHWAARLVDDPSAVIDIECERWNDARAFARMASAGREVVLEPVYVPAHERWQVKWAGNAMDQRDAPHLIARIRNQGPFLPVGEIVFR